MKKESFKNLYRLARCGSLCSVACMTDSKEIYNWFLYEVYDLRFPRIGDKRGLRNNSRFVHYKTFDTLAGYFSHTLSKEYHAICKIL
jgi:hypothetical protein